MIFICVDIRKVVVLKVLLSLSEWEKFWNIHLTFSRLQRLQKCDFCCCVCCASGNVFYERAVFTISGYFYSLRKKILLCTTLQPWEVSPAKLFSFRSPPFTSTSIQVAANKLLGLLQTLWRFDREAVWLRISLLEEIGRQLFCNFHLLVRFSWFKEGKELIQRELV